MFVGDFGLAAAEIARSRGVIVGEIDDEADFGGRVREDEVCSQRVVDVMEKALDLICRD